MLPVFVFPVNKTYQNGSSVFDFGILRQAYTNKSNSRYDIIEYACVRISLSDIRKTTLVVLFFTEKIYLFRPGYFKKKCCWGGILLIWTQIILVIQYIE